MKIDYFDESNGNHRIANEYIEVNGKNINYIYEYSIKRENNIDETQLENSVKNKANNLKAKYEMLRFSDLYKVKFFQPISYMSYFKESLFGDKNIVYSNYMTHEEAKLYEMKRKRELEIQKQETKRKDDIFKEKMKRLQQLEM